MAKSWFVAVAGLMGAGKTTLARGLASALGWSYLPETQPATLLLKDLFTDPSRWAFEIQTAFLVTKALQLKEALYNRVGVVLDRTLYEDADVFAEYFYKKGHIDARSYNTYRALADHFFQELPPPHLVILCDCPIDVARSRLARRAEGAAKYYPPGHLEEIADFYSLWRERYNKSDLVVVDTHDVDIRLKKNIDLVSRDVRALLGRRDESSQLDLFGELVADPSYATQIIQPVKLLPYMNRRPPPSRIAKPEVRVTPFPSAYIAAPFTGLATCSPSRPDNALMLFENAPAHGILAPGAYRSFLLSIERALRRLGIWCVIPHRDVNAWGERSLTPTQVLTLCSRYVLETDLFVGILATSHGAHYEFGIAQGLGKPSIIIKTPSIEESFIAQGTSNSFENVYTLKLKTEAEVEQALVTPEVRRFLRRFLPVTGE